MFVIQTTFAVATKTISLNTIQHNEIAFYSVFYKQQQKKSPITSFQFGN